MKEQTKQEDKMYRPEYPILNAADLLPRDQIRLVPEDELSPFDRAELVNLRRGIEYNLLAADTPENREAVAIKTAYYQMVAYKEGWVFDPGKYQVKFVDPKHLLGSESTHRRIFEITSEAGVSSRGLSPEGRLGFKVNGNRGQVMGHEETDGLAARLNSFFTRLKGGSKDNE